AEIGVEKAVGSLKAGGSAVRAVVSVVCAIGNDNRKPRQHIIRKVCGELGEVHDLGLRPIYIAENIAVPRGPVMAAIVGGAIVIVRRGNGASGGSIGLSIDLPGDAGIVHLAKDVVIGDRRSTTISCAAKIVCSWRQGAGRKGLIRFATARSQP